MKKILGILALVFGIFPSAVHAEAFNNDSVIALSSAGVGDGVLLSKIGSLPCSYDVSTNEIIRMKNANVSNEVISAMVDRCVGSSRAQGVENATADPLVKRKPGIYIQRAEQGASTLAVIRPTTVTSLQVTGNGSILFPFMARLILPQPAAQTTAQSGQPVFYFYFEAGDVKTGDFGTSVSAAAQSPSEFSLVHFKIKSGQREMAVGKANAFKLVAGIDPKNTIPFSVDEAGDGTFKVEMGAPLEAGQYAFVLRAGSDAYRIYAFQVK